MSQASAQEHFSWVRGRNLTDDGPLAPEWISVHGVQDLAA